MPKENYTYTLNRILPLLLGVVLRQHSIELVSQKTGKSEREIKKLIAQHLGVLIQRLSDIKETVSGMESVTNFYDELDPDYAVEMRVRIRKLYSLV